MSKIKNNIEHFFERSARMLYRNPIKTLLIIFLFLGVPLCQIPKTTVDTSSKAMFHENDPSLIDYNAFLDQFGRSEMIIIAVKPPDIFKADFLVKLKSLHNDLEREVPHIKNVFSLVNARRTLGKGDMLIVEELLKDFSENQIDPSILKNVVMNNPYYQNNIISEDGLWTAILLELDTSVIDKTDAEEDFLAYFEDNTFMTESGEGKSHKLSPEESHEIIEAINVIKDRYQGQNFSMAISGGTIIADVYNRAIGKDMKLCLILGSITVIFFLALLFQRISGVILPIVVVELAVFSTIGLMAIFNSPITELTMVIPAFLLSVGVGDSVHVLAIFFQQLQRGENKEDAIAYAMGHSGLAIVLTSLTTAAGLLSFYFADLIAIADMGVFAACGVLMALICTIIMLPPLLAITPLKEYQKTRMTGNQQLLNDVLQFFVDFATTHPGKILFFSLLLFAISVLFVVRLQFSHDILSYFPDSMLIKKDLLLIDREFNGMTPLEIVVDTQQENGIYDPEILNDIEKFSSEVKKIRIANIYVGKVLSINDILKESNQALHENNPDFYTIPNNRKAIAQQLFLFETSGSNDLDRIVDSQFSKTHITIKTPSVDAVIYKNFLKDIKELAYDIFQGKADITLTGGVVLIARTVPAALHSMAKSYVIAFIVITLMMILLVGNVKTGLLSMLPNLLPIVFVMGIMGFAGISLNLTTLMIGSIAIGLVVDDTVHFMVNFQKYYRIDRDAFKAVEETLLGTGRAMLMTTLILSFGFFVLMLASLHHMVKFGFFTGIIIIFALLADFLLAPALMVLVSRSRYTFFKL